MQVLPASHHTVPPIISTNCTRFAGKITSEKISRLRVKLNQCLGIGSDPLRRELKPLPMALVSTAA